MSTTNKIKQQSGVFLLEALIAILIFAMGILGIVALGATAIAAQNDAQYRTEAANYASEIVGSMWGTVDRTNDTTFAASLATFSHLETTGTNVCEFSGTASTNTAVTNWLSRITTISATNKGLPGATDAAGVANRQQIIVNTAANGLHQVTVTICWQTAKDVVPRRHTYVAFVN